jgi:glycosyltransferase involved in cell wall biosynthesis
MQPLFTVFTPLHAAGNAFILEAYNSLRAQTFLSWEWVIVQNNGGFVPYEIQNDPRVIAVRAGDDLEGIGALKKYACSFGSGSYLVELDADDLLVPQALESIVKNATGGVEFLFSDFAEFQGDRQPVEPFDAVFGWHHHHSYLDSYLGLNVMHAPEAAAQNLRRIEWSPNHIRVWQRDFYNEIGGHNPIFRVGDDHNLLVRTYLAGARMVRIPECLYLYRVHEKNTVKTKNTDIQMATNRVYNASVWALAEEWCRREKLAKIDLCGGIDSPPDYTSVDLLPAFTENHVVCDLNGPWKPFASNSVGLIRAQDALEHLRDPIHTMNEAYRVLAPGGFLMIQVPSTNGKGAFCDPTHVSFWNDLSFRYYTHRNFARYIPAFKGRFAVSRVQEWYPTIWHTENNVPYIEAHLIALKDGYHHYGEVNI